MEGNLDPTFNDSTPSYIQEPKNDQNDEEIREQEEEMFWNGLESSGVFEINGKKVEIYLEKKTNKTGNDNCIVLTDVEEEAQQESREKKNPKVFLLSSSEAIHKPVNNTFENMLTSLRLQEMGKPELEHLAHELVSIAEKVDELVKQEGSPNKVIVSEMAMNLRIGNHTYLLQYMPEGIGAYDFDALREVKQGVIRRNYKPNTSQ